MIHVRQIRTDADVDAILQSEKPVILFKHSTTCPISARAHQQWQAFVSSSEGNLEGALVRVIEERPLSRAFESRLGVRHQSPQAILIRNGQAAWHASHGNITVESLRQATAGL